jgi:hypothetical protein
MAAVAMVTKVQEMLNSLQTSQIFAVIFLSHPHLVEQRTKMCGRITRTVTSLSDTPRLQYYDVQTLEYMYISKLPMNKERIWTNVKETTSHLQNKLTKNIHLGVEMCMKEYGSCQKFGR